MILTSLILPHLAIGLCLTLYGICMDKTFFTEHCPDSIPGIIVFLPGFTAFGSIVFGIVWPFVLHDLIMGVPFIDKELRR